MGEVAVGAQYEKLSGEYLQDCINFYGGEKSLQFYQALAKEVLKEVVKLLPKRRRWTLLNEYGSPGFSVSRYSLSMHCYFYFDQIKLSPTEVHKESVYDDVTRKLVVRELNYACYPPDIPKYLGYESSTLIADIVKWTNKFLMVHEKV